MRPVGISKGIMLGRVLQIMAESEPLQDVDFVLVAGHFLSRDENIFSLLTGEPESGAAGGAPGAGQAAAAARSAAAATAAAAAATAARDQHLSPSLAERLQGGGAPAQPAQPAQPARGHAHERAQEAGPAAYPAPHHHHHHHGGATVAGGVHAVAPHDLPFPVPPTFSFTCTVGRGLTSKAGWVHIRVW